MSKILIGVNADKQPLYLTDAMRRRTHTHVIGSSGTGKSKFLQRLIQADIAAGKGVCLIDPHGPLYHDVLKWCYYHDIGLHGDHRRLILLNPSQPDFITGFNPFFKEGESDISVQVNRHIDAVIRPWGAMSCDETPTLARTLKLLFTFAVETGETLPNAAKLLEFARADLRGYALTVTKDSYIRSQWLELQQVKTFRDWTQQVLSTENRLSRFLGSTAVRRFMGLPLGNLNIQKIMDEGHILLVNLGESSYLHPEAAKVFGSLLIYEIFHAALRRANECSRSGDTPPLYTLVLDEFQNYVTEDLAQALDQIRKGGVHLVMAHQHLAHFADNPRLAKSVFTNARIRAVFGGLTFEDACIVGNEMFLPDLNSRQIKRVYFHTMHLYEEETRLVRSQAKGESTSLGVSAGKSGGTAYGKAQGKAHGTAYGTAQGTSSTSGYSSGSGTGFMSGMGTSSHFGLSEGLPDSTSWNDFSSSSFSDYSADTYSDATTEISSEVQSEVRSEVQSEVASQATTAGVSVGHHQAEAASETVVPFLRPVPVQELTTEAEWTREEKLSIVAQMLKEQLQRHCFIKLETEKTQALCVPLIRRHSISQESLLEYEQAVYRQQNALPAADVDRLLIESEQHFLRAVHDTPPVIDIPAQPAATKPKRTKRTTKTTDDQPSLWTEVVEPET
jgi:hypothetical protein